VTTYCSSCGAPATPEALFCSSCGQSLLKDKNCPTCGQIWPSAPTPLAQASSTQTNIGYSQPIVSEQAWPAPIPQQVTLSSLPAPAPNPMNLQSFPPPSQGPVNPSVRPPNYGRNFVEGVHCGNCGTGIEQGQITCSVCGTNDFSKIPGAVVKSALTDTNSQEIKND